MGMLMMNSVYWLIRPRSRRIGKVRKLETSEKVKISSLAHTCWRKLHSTVYLFPSSPPLYIQCESQLCSFFWINCYTLFFIISYYFIISLSCGSSLSILLCIRSSSIIVLSSSSSRKWEETVFFFISNLKYILKRSTISFCSRNIQRWSLFYL